jgi:ADP-ribose pyrophosphatase YjhB (NUDIX family)
VGRLDGWQFCPRCGTPGEHRRTSFTCPACGHVEWPNPSPGSQAVVERDGSVLLGRRAFEPARGLWDLPGGFVDEHEHPLAALHRELREETGLEVEPTEFLGIWMQPYEQRIVLCLTWLARPVGGVERAGDDLAELRWFAADELPGPDELAFETYVEILSLWRARHEDA